MADHPRPINHPDLALGGLDLDEELVYADLYGPERYEPVPPLVAAARRDQARIDRTLADNECVHGWLPADPALDCDCWRAKAA